nr:MAG TPA: hypothetical protein [Caudoviricetes sp.]
MTKDEIIVMLAEQLAEVRHAWRDTPLGRKGGKRNDKR